MTPRLDVVAQHGVLILIQWAEMYDVCRFWLDRGCAGFRLDAVSRLSVPEDMPDAEIRDEGAKYQNADKYMKHGQVAVIALGTRHLGKELKLGPQSKDARVPRRIAARGLQQ